MEHQNKYILLLCNDHAQVVQMIGILKSYWQSAIIEVTDQPDELLHLIEQRTPSLVIVVSAAGDSYYIECIKNMRSNKGIDNVPVYIYTTFPVRKDLDRLCQQMGGKQTS